MLKIKMNRKSIKMLVEYSNEKEKDIIFLNESALYMLNNFLYIDIYIINSYAFITFNTNRKYLSTPVYYYNDRKYSFYSSDCISLGSVFN